MSCCVSFSSMVIDCMQHFAHPVHCSLPELMLNLTRFGYSRATPLARML